MTRGIESRENVMYHVSADVRQAKVATAVSIRELFVIEAEEMQDGGMEVVDVDLIFSDLIAVFVCRAIGHASADSGASQPRGKCVRMVRTADRAVVVGCATKFGGPDDQSFRQQPSLFEVL